MPQIINTNIGSLMAQRNLDNTQAQSLTALTRLSSGLRINSAKDDAAGLAISTRLTAEVRGLGVAIRNANDGISMSQTAEGALGAMTENLQRLRELALQSANATNGESDRQAMNAEAQQLIAEITRVSEESNFNGRNLLDGSLNSSVQIGTSVGQTVSFGVNQVTTDKLGGGVGAGISARGTDDVLSTGDLIINGVAIASSSAADDTSSTDNAGASAIAKAATINASSAESGVTAYVSANRVSGVDMSATDAAAESGTITLNGVDIEVTTGAISKSANRAAVAEAINAKSGQTGIVAIDSGSDTAGVILQAEDGRNIQIEEAGSVLSAEVTGLNFTPSDSATFEGGYTLVADNGKAIEIAGGNGSGSGDLSHAGLLAGSYDNGVASVTSISVLEGAAADPVDNALAGQALVINGVNIARSQAADDTSSDTTANSSDAAGSAIAIAASINRASPETGVKAEVNSTVVTSAASVVADATTGDEGTIMINGFETGTITTTGDLEADRITAIGAINGMSGNTGVVASDNGSSVTLTASDGRNVSLALVSGDATFGAAIGLNESTPAQIATIAANTAYDTGAVTTMGTVTLNSSKAFTLESGSNGDAGVTDVGFVQGNFGGAETGQFLTDLDITTVEGAERALGALDNALDSVNAERANLGAIQNRLESAISSLSVNVENITSARSRILDADFAKETAELSRTQVLQQAGVSILAQANAQPQLILALLQ